MNKPKLKFGDRVTTRKLGLPIVGNIVGIMNAQSYSEYIKLDISSWTAVYPNWKDTFVYLVEFDEPTRTVNYNEFCEKFNYHPNNPETKFTFETIYTPMKQNIYPEEDLSLWEL